MKSLAFITRRARAGLGLVLTILALVTATTAIIGGTVGYARAAATIAAREALMTQDASGDAALQVRTRQADDAQAQDTLGRALIEEAFAPARVRITRTLASELQRVEGRDRRLQVISSDNLTGGSAEGLGLGASGESGNHEGTSQDQGLAGLVKITQGAAPQSGRSPVQAALHTGAAGQWGVAVGDSLLVGDVEVEVTALFRPINPHSPGWVGDPLAETGFTDDVVGPLIINPAQLTEFSDPPFAEWVIEPDADNVQPQDLGPLATAAGALRSTMDTDEFAVRGIVVDGDLAPTAAQADRNLQTARALNVVPLIVLFMVSVIAVGQLARILATARRPEVDLLLARGASRRQVTGWSAAESITVTALGTIVGIALAVGVLRAVPAGAQQTGAVAAVGVATGGAVLVALIVVSVHQVRHVTGARVSADSRSGRASAATALGTVALTVAAAGLSWAQLRRYGSPLVTDADGTLGTDLVAGAAPALMLAGAAMLALALFAPLAHLIARGTARTTRLGPHLSALHVSRGLITYAVPVVLTVLAVGATTVSGMYAATSADLRDRLAELSQGADIRATVDDGGVGNPEGQMAAMPPVAALDGVQSAAPVWLRDIDIADSPTLLVASPLHQLAGVAIVPDGAARPADLITRLAGQGDPQPIPANVEIPAGTDTVEVAVDVDLRMSESRLDQLSGEFEDFAASLAQEEDLSASDAGEAAFETFFGSTTADSSLTVSLVLRDADTGIVTVVEAGDVEFTPGLMLDASGALASTPVTVADSFEIAVTAGSAAPQGYQVVGVELEPSQPLGEFDLGVTIAVVVEGQRQPTTGDWVVAGATRERMVGQPEDPLPEVMTADEGGLTVRRAGVASSFSEQSDISLRRGSSQGVPLPLAITASVAQTNNLRVDSPVEIKAFGTAIPAQVAAVVDAVPGTLEPDVAVVDAGALSQALRSAGADLGDPDELWLSTTGTPGGGAKEVAGDVAAMPGITAASVAPPVAVTDANSAVRLVFWVASAGSILLAVTGIAAVAATVLSARRPEVAALRALGMPPGAQGRTRAVELGAVVVVGVVAGLLGGWLVARAVIPELAISTTLPGQAELPAPLRLELTVWVALLGAGVTAAVAIVITLARAVRSQALDRGYREEIR